MQRVNGSIALIAGLLLTATACGGGSESTAPDTGPTGVYRLVAVQGRDVPWKIFDGPYVDLDNNRRYRQLTVTITGGKIQLGKDGRFTMAVEASYVADGAANKGSVSMQGNYRLWDNGNLDLKPDNAPNSALSGWRDQWGGIGFSLDFMRTGDPYDFFFEK
jgi:hypothetical protein